MRALYFLLLITSVITLLLYIINMITGVNIFKKYGKQVLKFFGQFLLLVLAIYVVFIISGLVD